MQNQEWVKELKNIRKRKYSQGYQDGIIEYIFKNINTTNKFCVEFGFNSVELTGGSGSNTARLILDENWDYILFDSEYENTEINLYKEKLTPVNIGEVFKKYDVPQNPDYVSIDVDSIDLWLFRSMLICGYRPRVISVEYNMHFPIDVSATVEPDYSRDVMDAVYGASMLALDTVAKEYDYKLVCVEDNLDMFFIEKNIIPDVEVSLSEFSNYTDKLLFKTPTKERMKLFIEYPSLNTLEKTPWSELI